MSSDELLTVVQIIAAVAFVGMIYDIIKNYN